MKRLMILALSGLLWLGVWAQPRGMQPKSTYELVDEVRKELKLDQKQFEKVYSAYDKYNKTVFGDVSNKNGRPTLPPGGHGGPRGGHGGSGMGNPPAGGRPDFGGAPQGGSGSDRFRPGNDGTAEKAPKPADFEKMEKTKAKAEEKLVKSMQKLFKKDPSAFSRWQTIRDRQLKLMMPPAPGK